MNNIETAYLRSKKRLGGHPCRLVLDRRICESQLSTSRQLAAVRESRDRIARMPSPPPDSAPVNELQQFWARQAKTARLQNEMTQRNVRDVEIVNQNEKQIETYYAFEQIETVRRRPLRQRLPDDIWDLTQEIKRVTKVDEWLESVLLGRIAVQTMQLRRMRRELTYGFDFE
ncbi:hypothetical protein SS50377_26304 [Spironucleus salmonicida]|uniref:Uncharacterized protein n=2 Tax=Spironucleus salmonicida TaxID=348837 RepID=V6LUI2_9EUKA|nr:hypothetical protein SS50377_26301 [Spironucleus salmonicida]KAH0572097.1 hypothetical protein SS50377_26304 [Spironucleus salmonicida]|eukprot:EST47918.1 Hypothetical protein SS50377_11979 [Spironucleus salmonicida]